ncbi:MAG: hypothetical protein A2Z18_08035 [Armatimonadetes bacterium RBG_16_58_9]|nr:MAG: hypothetical protein A2Z18_08035 [Armatimonadetes bacterium RBG_16_58_9]
MEILAFADYYLPGYKFGGPIRTIANTVSQLGQDYRFKIVTRDRDFGDAEPYPDISVGSWNALGDAEVFYASGPDLSLPSLRKLIQSTRYDVLYCNSFLSPNFTIKPLLLRRLKLIPQTPMVVAPRGELSFGALAIKSAKKRAYIAAAKAMRLYESVTWQASSSYEENDIRRRFGDQANVVIAPDLPGRVNAEDEEIPHSDKTAGRLKAVFLSRICRMKNLRGALLMLKDLVGEVEFNVCGPLEDSNYWSECQEVISELPPNIWVRYCGIVAPDRIGQTIRGNDLFFLPTLGENFGHAIVEALVAGRPVLVSDRTPWRNLEERGVGWDISLDQPERFQAALRKCLAMDAAEHRKWSQRAQRYGLELTRDETAVEKNRLLFDQSLCRDATKATV